MYTERTAVANDRTVQLYYWGDNYYNRSASSGSHHWPKDKGVVWVQLQSGVLVCTNTYEGIDRTVTADGTVVQIELKRKDEGGHRTYFEFDWYPPTNLDGKDFLLKVMSDHHRSNGSYYRSKEHNFGEFTGADQDQAPIITDPFSIWLVPTESGGTVSMVTPSAGTSKVRCCTRIWRSTSVPSSALSV
jgi:hypothetical protein